LLISLLLGLFLDAYAEVVVHEDIALKGRPMMLQAETRGRIFTRGGELVEFQVDGKSIGKALSGGDGRAFKEFTPGRAGLFKIKAVSKGDEDSGLILSLGKGGGVVFIDAAGGLFKGPFSKSPRQGSQEAVKQISERHPIVYLQTVLPGRGVIKKWLESNGFPPAPLMEWREGRVFRETVEKELKIRAVIGSAEVIESAKDYTTGLYSLEGQGKSVKDWKGISESLK
jgi:hypothetical protein